jgi:acetylornithine/succinyldiaminopimelate/putrescine aminotransferase
MLKDLPSCTRNSYGALEHQYGARNYKPFDVVLTRGRGVWVWDIDGRRYLDCLAAYSAVNQGHCHPRILAALTKQASRLAITSRAFMNDQFPLFCKELCAATHSHKVLPMNSGAEAVESAIKVARKWGYEVKGVPKDRAEVIVCANNFHGRTSLSSALAPIRPRATASAPSRPDSAASCPSVTPPRSKRRSRPIRSPSWSNPSRARRG